MSVAKAFIEGGKQIFKRSKPKKTFSKNIGIGKIKQEGLYKTLGKDKYGDIQIITKGPQKGYRVPLDKKGFTERRPWAADPDYKPSYGERTWSPQIGATKKASGGLIKGFPKIAKKGWR